MRHSGACVLLFEPNLFCQRQIVKVFKGSSFNNEVGAFRRER